MITESTHTGSFRRDNNGDIVRARYFHSKWDKEVGDTLTIDGHQTKIEIIGNSRNDVIDQMNDVIKEQNNRFRNQTYKL